MKFLLYFSLLIFATGMYVGCDENSVNLPITKDTTQNHDTIIANDTNTTTKKKKGVDTIPPTLGELVPLAIGNSWEYKITTYDKSTFEKPLRDTFVTVTYVADTIIGGNRWFLTQSGARNGNFGDGFYSWSPTFPYPILLYKYPVKKGEVFEHDTQIFYPNSDSTLKGDWNVTSTDTIIHVPAGDFKCIVYSAPLIYKYPYHPAMVFPGKFYVAPGVGIIQTESFIPGSGNNTGENLLSTRKVLLKATLK